MRSISRDDGFTVTELLVSAVVMLLVVGAALTTFKNGMDINDTANQPGDANQQPTNQHQPGSGSQFQSNQGQPRGANAQQPPAGQSQPGRHAAARPGLLPPHRSRGGFLSSGARPTV